jgi:peptidoglycan hydrolase-like protein with peptidoglycan-binding domain
MSRRRRIAALAAIVLVACVAVAVVLVQSGGHTASAAASGIPAGYTTAAVERRTLTDRSTVDGALGFSGTVEIYDRLAGTFTWLPAVGTVIRRGGTLFKLNDLPIALMYGSVPAYRALEQGVPDGPDVRELNANLVALGYDPYGSITVNDHFSEATAAAVRRWQHTEGLTETGEVELGRVVFAPGARRVTSAHVVIGQDPPGAESKADKPPASGKSKPVGSAKSPKSKNHSGSGSPSKPSGGEGSGKGSPSHASNEGSGSGSGEKEKGGSGSGEGGSGAPQLVLSTTADTQIVTLQLKATQQELAHLGESVPVTLPDGRTVHGHVSEVGTVATEANEGSGNGGSEKGGGGGGSGGNGNGENATIAVKVTLDHPIAHLDKAPVSVELVKSIRRNVLAVPATALVATGGGGFAVRALEGNRRAEISVTPGMFANGYVQVEGAGLGEGMTVLVPR